MSEEPPTNNPLSTPVRLRKKRIVIITTISVILVALGVGVGYLLYGRSAPEKTQDPVQQSQTTQTNNDVQKDPEPQLQPEEVTAKIKDTYAAQYTLLNIDENNQPKSNEMSIRLSESSPPYKVDGYDFYTDYKGGSSLDLMPHDVTIIDGNIPTATSKAIRANVAKIYIEFGLEKKQTIGKADMSSERDVYIGKGLVCTIEQPTAGTSSNTASCGIITSYKDASAKAKPFADALSRQGNFDSSTILVGLQITDSPVSGYQRAALNQGSVNGGGGALALFYKKDSGAWNYFTHTQEMLLCSRYASVDLQNAFKNERCYLDTNGTLGTVK